MMSFHGIDVRPAFRTVKVGSYLSLKTAVPKLFKADVVYKFVCPLDKDAQYIGETQRQLFRRVDEHCSPGKNSAIFDHFFNCKSCQNHSNITSQFSILYQCNNRNNILSQEALCIKKFRPMLNNQLGPYRGTRVPVTIF